jgi:predicted DNA-binding protein YlxM (UPF0122 family)
MNLEERVQIAILTKYYGNLLTERQKDILSMYVDSNLSLAEVSEELNISRQAVKDALDKAFLTLKDTEEKLHFVDKDAKLKEIIRNKAPNQIDEATKLELIAYLED